MKFSSNYLQMKWILVSLIIIGVASDSDYDYDEDDASGRSIRVHSLYQDRPCQYRRREGVCKRRSECRRPTRHTCRHGLNPIVCCLDKVTTTEATTTSTTTTTTRRPRPNPKPDTIKNIDITFPGCGSRSPNFEDEIRRTGSSGRSRGAFGRGGLFSRRNKREIKYVRSKRQLGSAARPIIVGGAEARSNSWPWMVAIFRKPSPGVKDKTFLCGASLISKKYVLTASHCFDGERRAPDPSKFTVIVGSHTSKDGTEYSVDDILIHPEYQKRQYYNDITLLRISGSVQLSKKVYPVCLPSDGLKSKIKVGASNVTVTGWGDTTFGGVNSKVLQEVSMPIVPLKECNASYSKIPLTNFPKGITTEFMCAGYKEGGKDACQGDSGGPMTTELTDKSWVQLGIVSFGYGCARAGFPGVYTRLSHYTQWLYDNTDLGK